MRDASVLQYIGNRMKMERERLGYSQEEFAELAGCSQAQYSRFERGERELGALQLLKLSNTLQSPITSFFPADRTVSLDTLEVELLEAWRARDLASLLALIAERWA